MTVQRPGYRPTAVSTSDRVVNVIKIIQFESRGSLSPQLKTTDTVKLFEAQISCVQTPFIGTVSMRSGYWYLAMSVRVIRGRCNDQM